MPDIDIMRLRAAVLNGLTQEHKPIPAQCPHCKQNFVGSKAIVAASLDGFRCDRCDTSLVKHPRARG